MTLVSPRLDDRGFQDLVDDAKRLVQQRCPEWTDHNVSDPGVTLIEAFAFMTDQLIYRLNRVPDKLYVEFLNLIGLRLQPPIAARTELTFWLSAPQPHIVHVPVGTEVSTERTEHDDVITFETTDDVLIPPRRLDWITFQAGGGEIDAALTHQDVFDMAEHLVCFSSPPRVDDALLLGLDDAAPGCALAVRVSGPVAGVGVMPKYPPLSWEAWTGDGWSACEVDSDTTGGLNRSGDVIVHIPRGHVSSVVGQRRAGWLRCRVIEPPPGFATYSQSPTLRSIAAFTVGGTGPAVHARIVHDEILGLSEGVPGQVFALANHPVVDENLPLPLQVAGGADWQQWTEVESFVDGLGEQNTFRVDRGTGQVQFAPAVRAADGELVRYGSVPPKGAPIRVMSYRTGGGARGNVAEKMLRVLRASIPFIRAVENRHPSYGGVAMETLDQAKVRGPLELQTHDRAVTVADYEHLARQAEPSLARVRCAPARADSEAGGVRVLVVPEVPERVDGRLAFEQLRPRADVLERLSRFLDERRLVGTRLLVAPPLYQGITVVARIVAAGNVSHAVAAQQALDALFGYFDPLIGGPAGTGWPFGRPVQSGEVYAVLQRLPAVELVDEVRLYGADPVTGQRGEVTQRIDLDPDALIFSFDHQIRVSRTVE